MDLFAFIAASFIYIMVIHFAFGIKKEFDLFQLALCFVIAGAFGYYLQSFAVAFILGIFFSLLFY